MHNADELSRPGAHIESAIAGMPDIIGRTIRFMSRNPAPIPTGVQTRFCSRLANMAAIDFPDTRDVEENMAHFVKGMQWGFGMAVSSGIKQPSLHVSRYGLRIPSEDRMAMLRDNIRNYASESRDLLCTIMGGLYQNIDPGVDYSNSVFWGFVSVLYMVDQAECNKLAKQRDALEKAEIDMAFNLIADEEEQAQKEAAWERKCDETEAWYGIVAQLQGDGLWPDQL